METKGKHMKLSRKQFARAGLVALAALALAVPAWAGQVNLATRNTSILETVTTSVANTLVSSITASGISETINEGGLSTVTSSITITELFSATVASVSFEVAQEGLNYTSPFDNLVITPTIVQSINVGSTSGLTNVHATAGSGNVSVASNGLFDGGVLASIIGTLSGTNNAGGTQAVALALTPGFALQNSNALSLVQAAAVAVAGGLVDGAVSALDIQQSGVNEYSPHGNQLLVSGSIGQNLSIAGVSGLTNLGVQVGAGNVQAAHTTVLFGPSMTSIAAGINQ
jgi:hypothetical protein